MRLKPGSLCRPARERADGCRHGCHAPPAAAGDLHAAGRGHAWCRPQRAAAGPGAACAPPGAARATGACTLRHAGTRAHPTMPQQPALHVMPGACSVGSQDMLHMQCASPRTASAAATPLHDIRCHCRASTARTQCCTRRPRSLCRMLCSRMRPRCPALPCLRLSCTATTQQEQGKLCAPGSLPLAASSIPCVRQLGRLCMMPPHLTWLHLSHVRRPPGSSRSAVVSCGSVLPGQACRLCWGRPTVVACRPGTDHPRGPRLGRSVHPRGCRAPDHSLDSRQGQCLQVRRPVWHPACACTPHGA